MKKRNTILYSLIFATIFLFLIGGLTTGVLGNDGEIIPNAPNSVCGDALVVGDGYCVTDLECEPDFVCEECMCVPDDTPFCVTNADCDDQNDCTEDVCVDGTSCTNTLNDNIGPIITNPFIDPQLTNGYADVGANVYDECSNVDHANYYVDNACQNGGISMNAVDGSFDSNEEDIIKLLADFRLFPDGRHDVYMKAWDTENQESNCAHVYFDLDKVAPDNPKCSGGALGFGMSLNGECGAEELLVCDNDPLLTAYICDAQSRMQAAEYFIDDFGQANWQGIMMDATDGEFDEQCEEVQSLVDMDLLEDGTHYLKLHGKDRAENWGKLGGFDPVSFIKDTTAPSTNKSMIYAGGMHEDCDIPSIMGKTLTDGCHYVKDGTQVVLTSADPDPQQTGEFAGDVIIHYKVWWSYDGELWRVNQTGQSNKDEDVSFTLTGDSYHLVEYWAEDSCGNIETHHFELDMVDTQAPNSWKDLGERKVECSTADKALYGIEDCWYITKDTPIALGCEDNLPHPVGGETLYYKVDWKEIVEGSWEEGTWMRLVVRCFLPLILQKSLKKGG